MDPVIFTLGPFQIRWYGVLMAAAFLVGYFILRKLALEKGIDLELIEKYFIYIFLGIIIGARLGEVLFYDLSYYLADPIKVFYVWNGGLSSHGGFIGGILATLLFCRLNKIKFYFIADIVVIPIALGSVFIRIGNFINGEIVGRETTLPWGMVFDRYDNKVRHPSQIYEAVMNLTVFAILLCIRKVRKLPEGFVFWSFVLIYSFLRFFIEFFKEYQTLTSGLTMGQWLSIVFMIISLYFFYGYRDFIIKSLKKKSRSKR